MNIKTFESFKTLTPAELSTVEGGGININIDLGFSTIYKAGQSFGRNLYNALF